MRGSKRLHFGVIFSNFDDTCQYDIWTGIVEYAQKNDIHLTAYIGVYQTTEYDLASHYETCFEIIKNSGSLDGVIIFSGFIASMIGNEEFEKYIAKISKILPLISVSYVMPGIPSVLVDNTAGIYDATDHLIKVHDKKHIAFVKGPDGHIEAEDRFEGYKRALSENAIAYDERYVFPGNFTQESGELAVRKLLGSPDISADAIVACDDTIAIGVLNELKKFNLLVPADIAVAGFDDDRDAATFVPSISTVRQDFPNIGSISANLLLKQVNGEPVEPVTYTSPVFVTRQSCGCLGIELSGTETRHKDDLTEINSLSSYVKSKIKHLFVQSAMKPQTDEWVTALIESLKKRPFLKERFLHLLNEKLINYSQYSRDVIVWNEVLNILTKGIELYYDEVDCPHKALSTLVFATALVQDIRFKEMMINELELSDNRVMLRRIASTLVSIFDVESLVKELHKSLPELSINTAIIGLYRTPIKSGDSDADRTIDRLIGFDGSNELDSKFNDSFPFSGFSEIDKFDFKERRDMFLFPLFFKNEEYGILLMPYDPAITVDTYETLRVNISTAIKGAGLIKEVQSALEQATEASKAKSAFLSTMSHEMRTPMNAIIGMTAIGKRASGIEEKNYALNKVEEASSHLLSVINDVLDMAKIEANKLILSPVEFNFSKMLQKVLTVIKYRADEKNQTLSVSADKNIPQYIVGDDHRLMQVITNLLSNAIKFTPEGGKIRLAISLINETDGYCELCISVTDDGIGISPEQQTNLFRAFEQAESGTSRNYGGTGLGLVICKRIIELMGGRIWVESELGKGARFVFTIKALYNEKNTQSPVAGDTSSGLVEDKVEHEDFTGKTVLLVEDIDINREIFIALLEDTGLIVECAENGREALDILEANPGKFDIIFMDVQMPVMGGHEATRCIRRLPALQGINLPIIAMTANVFKSDIEECIEAGMDDHLGKPIDIDKLLYMLRVYL